MIRPRVIVCLQVFEGRLIKTLRFSDDHVYLGDPINTVRILNSKFADELVFCDIGASRLGLGPNFDLIERLASEALMPVTYIGGVSEISQAERLFEIGIEKVGFETAILYNQSLPKSVSDKFGSQAVVASISYVDSSRDGLVTTSGNSLTFEEIFDLSQNLAVGEILLYSASRDGTQEGLDTATIENLSRQIGVPLLAMGGVGGIDHIKDGIRAGASGVVCGTFFTLTGRRRAPLTTYLNDSDFVYLIEGE